MAQPSESDTCLLVFPISGADQKAGAGLAFLFEVLSKIASRVECAPLDRRYGQTKASSGFRNRKALQFSEKNHHPQAVP